MIDFIENLLAETAHISKTHFGGDLDIATKRHEKDYVTNVDKEVNQLCIDSIRKAFPDDMIISEEADVINGHTGRTWYIDPIDGTENFVMGIPLFANMVGCAENGEMIASGIALPMQADVYLAEKGKGATKNGKAIRCTETCRLAYSAGLISAGWSPARTDLTRRILDYTRDQRLRISCFGSCGVDEVWVANGTHDWILNTNCNQWDYAAGALILQEAGCTVTNLDGSPWKPGDTEMVAANPALHAELMKILS